MITPAEVAVALRRPTPDEGSADSLQWQMWIDDARMLLSSGDGTHKGFGDLNQLDEATVDYVIREAVVAQVRRPDDATQVQVQVDDGRTSRTYSSGTGRVRILDDWWSMLDVEGDTRQGAFSVRPAFEPDRRVCW